MNKNWIVDFETMVNCTILCAEDYKTDERHEFVINRDRNDIAKLIDFLEQNITNVEWHISFNGLAFDGQVTHHILKNKWRYLKMDSERLSADIQRFAGGVIEKINKGEFPPYYFANFKHRHIDLFKQNHWDNKAKKTSLKWAEYSMDWYNIEEMPIHYTTRIENDDDLQTVIDYCWNDVGATKKIYEYSKGGIELRAKLSELYNLDLYSASETAISKAILGPKLSSAMNMDLKEFKALRTPRYNVLGRDIILDYVDFKTMKFEAVKTWVENLNIDFHTKMTKEQRKKLYTYNFEYKGAKTKFALGGIHGAAPTGIYESGNGKVIKSADVTSFYPNLIMQNNWSPAHIPPEIFIPEYRFFYTERQLIPKKDPINYTYKIILNATYGLSNEANSFMFDPELTMKITLNGQLLLAMLYEMLGERIPGIQPLMQNTDGLEMMFDEKYTDLYMEICNEWCKLTKLELEYADYTKMIIGDVNSYIAVDTNGNVKSKGRYEWEDQDKKKVGYFHKNKSFLIIPKAIHEYFINGTLPEDYLESNKNIFDYCAGVKVDGRFRLYEKYIEDGEVIERDLNKIVRYYISKEGNKLLKYNKISGTTSQLEAGKWMQIECNKIDVNKKFEDYPIDKEYYLEKIYNEIYNLENRVEEVIKEGTQQLELF